MKIVRYQPVGGPDRGRGLSVRVRTQIAELEQKLREIDE
jgi:hypothetical protein